MCQIIAIKTSSSGIQTLVAEHEYISETSMFLNNIDNSLLFKGGDTIGAVLSFGVELIRLNGKTSKEIFNNANNIIKSKSKEGLNIPDTTPAEVLLFSRQRPEMEGEISMIQPYINPEERMAVAVHGTIHNDEEIKKKYSLNVDIDTDIFRYLNYQQWNEAEGSFAVIALDAETHQIFKFCNGLSIFEKEITILGVDNIGTIVSTDPMHWIEDDTLDMNSIFVDTSPGTLYASFSGGMDISLSLYKAVSNKQYNKVILNYFAWGSKAEEIEIEQLDNFVDFYTSKFPNTLFKKEIIKADLYFKEYLSINGSSLPKIHKDNIDSGPEALESESPLAYVPYRNTQFALLLASKAESEGITNVDILFGLNLSEGMVFMDNSEGWMESINSIIKLGAKDYKQSKTFKVIAPYFQRTKTNMILEFKEDFGVATLEQLLQLSKSCYYPEADGSVCGKCGSCVLREKAIHNTN